MVNQSGVGGVHHIKGMVFMFEKVHQDLEKEKNASAFFDQMVSFPQVRQVSRSMRGANF